MTDSERFYTSILDFLEDPEESAEVRELLMWWNRYVSSTCSLFFALATLFSQCRQIFPTVQPLHRTLRVQSALGRLKEKREKAKAVAQLAASRQLDNS